VFWQISAFSAVSREPRTNAGLVPKFHVTPRAPHAALSPASLAAQAVVIISKQRSAPLLHSKSSCHSFTFFASNLFALSSRGTTSTALGPLLPASLTDGLRAVLLPSLTSRGSSFFLHGHMWRTTNSDQLYKANMATLRATLSPANIIPSRFYGPCQLEPGGLESIRWVRWLYPRKQIGKALK
jgi:hypothetical protein